MTDFTDETKVKIMNDIDKKSRNFFHPVNGRWGELYWDAEPSVTIKDEDWQEGFHPVGPFRLLDDVIDRLPAPRHPKMKPK